MTIKLGLIGLSEGNGHPYSWSAICNGYSFDEMESCGFPVIPRYLEEQTWPDDSISRASVTHVWTQNVELSQKIAKTVYIPNIVENYTDMINQVDAVLLARDDADTHYEFASPFLKAGLPVYIDKPIALSLEELDRLYELEQYPGQIFTCSALGYAKEYKLTKADYESVGNILHVYAMIPKDWEKYGVHIIEPVLKIIGDQGEIARSQVWKNDDHVSVNILWTSGLQTSFSTFGDASSPLNIRIIGDAGWKDLIFKDTFNAFKTALSDFICGIEKRDVRSDPLLIRKIVEIIEIGRRE